MRHLLKQLAEVLEESGLNSKKKYSNWIHLLIPNFISRFNKLDEKLFVIPNTVSLWIYNFNISTSQEHSTCWESLKVHLEL